jgi:hypothetical protein
MQKCSDLYEKDLAQFVVVVEVGIFVALGIIAVSYGTYKCVKELNFHNIQPNIAEYDICPTSGTGRVSRRQNY